MTKYKVKNNLEHPVRHGNIYFLPKQIKTLDFKPKSDKFTCKRVYEKKNSDTTQKEVNE
jgi:hypothetical protein